MSDQPSPPPKPKPGSLRDRIAAFEKGGTVAPGPAAPPPPRPKPAGFATWKPKQASPPSSPSASLSTGGGADHVSPTSRSGGMSASDAKDSVVKGGSLKERMAALQGKGAFGAPPPPAPKPALEKPKWKPPPVVAAPVHDDAESPPAPSAPPPAVAHKPELPSEEGEEAPVAPTPSAAPPAVVEGEEQPTETDPEEEERQRRAAIAARMARLGGAKMGMGPPVMGRKPMLPFKKPSLKEETKPDESLVNASGVATSPPPGVPRDDDAHPPEKNKSFVHATDAPTLVSSPPTEEIPTTSLPTKSSVGEPTEYFPARKSSESASLLSVDSSDSVTARSPSAMPVPAVPRRAAPPRKKVPKSPVPPPIEQDEVAELKEQDISPSVPVVDAPGVTEVQPAAAIRDEERLDTTASTEEILTEHPVEDLVLEGEKPPGTTGSGFDHAATSSQPSVVEHHADYVSPQGEPSVHQLPVQTPPEVEMEVLKPAREAEADEDEEEEEARRKRVTEKLAKMGGVNPFALPNPHPPRQSSISSPETVPVSMSPPPTELYRRASVDSQRRTSIGSQPRRTSVDSAIEPPQRKDSIRKSCVDSSMLFEETPAETLGLRPHSPEPIQKEGEQRKIESTTSNIQEEDENENYDEELEEPLTDSQYQQVEVEGSQYETHQLHRRMSRTLAYDQEEDNLETPPPPPPRVPHRESLPARESSMHPPRRIVPTTPDEEIEEQGNEGEAQTEEMEEVGQEDESENEGSLLSASHLFVPPPRARNRYSEDKYSEPPRYIPRGLDNDDEYESTDNESVPLPIPHRRSIDAYARDGDGESYAPSTPPPQFVSIASRPMRNIPPPPTRSHLRPGPSSDMGHDSDYDEVLPVRPMRPQDRPHSEDTPGIVPPPPLPASPRNVMSPLHHTPSPPHVAPPHRVLPPPPPPMRQPEELSNRSLTSSLSVPSEVLDEEEGDPIDPTFHSPSRRASSINLPSVSPNTLAGLEHLTHSHFQPPAAPVSAGEEPGEDDVESSKRRTIAERMAKLGGIKFGAAPPVPASLTRQAPSHPPPTRREDEQISHEPVAVGDEDQVDVGEEEEEEERARKERIAAKLAGMGGMRIGMMPLGIGSVAPQRSHVLRDESVSQAHVVPATSALPAHRAIPPPRIPPPQHQETDDSNTSEDGVRAEAEESEIEEVNYEDVQEETPPSIPTRSSRVVATLQRRQSTDTTSSQRRQSTDMTFSSIPPGSRPPVPTSLPNRRASVQTSRSARSASGDSGFGVAPPVRKASMTAPKSQTEYVIVDEPQSMESQDVPPHLPPGRRAVPGRPAPTLPPSDLADSISSQWELPSIPSASLDLGGGDLSMSWTDAGPSGTASSPPSQQPGRSPVRRDSKLSADELMTVWGRVGVQICEVATALFEKSKKSLIGDGTYEGFISAVLSEVPNVAPLSSGYGYVVYQQTGAAVQKRASEIMPGDVVELIDAKLKGHKGIQTYTQAVGAGEALLGIVGEFEPKKSKVRLYHANQHVGQQTVEAVSYRLEDLKSGTVKVYRVLEA